MRLKPAIRALVTFAIEVMAMGLLTEILPGVHVDSFETGVIAILVIGALNALVRPLLVALAINLGLILFAVVALVLNAVIVLLATRLVPGFTVDTPWAALQLAFGLAIVNTLVSGLLGINDDDSFYRNVIRWLARRRVPVADLSRPGTILIQIDGLAEAIVRREIESGGLPTLARWLHGGGHKLVGWECDVPSMTSSGQSGILYGNNKNIPAFRWYQKSTGRLLVSNHPRDAHLIDQRQATDDGLLRDHGSSVGNIFAGGAERCVLTMSRLTGDAGQVTARAQDLYDYFVNPYNLYRALGAMVSELVVEWWEALSQRRRNVQPRMNRGGSYPLVRAITCVLLRDITTWMLVADMFSGREIAYADYLGYDEVAHHAGPATDDALRTLRKMEGQLHQLESAARQAPRAYQFVVLSDHGQSTGATFRQRYGLTLDQLVHRLMESGAADVQLASGTGEGTGLARALLAEGTRLGGAVGAGMRRLHASVEFLRSDTPEPSTVAQAQVEAADVVVCASGNLGLVYFARQSGRLSIEAIQQLYPRLLAGLCQHPGIGFLMVFSETSGASVVLGSHGRRNLVDDSVLGEDPLSAFSPHTAALLRRLSTFDDVGDIVVNSLCEPDTLNVAAFEELIGCHGGTGGRQTAPFVLYPAEWGEAPSIVGAEKLHRFLAQHVGPGGMSYATPGEGSKP
jgi:uncharacterized membrane protein YvlD (DUF360 family)